jgi:RNA polymerase sigma factor (sigma-70 family)
VPKLESAGLATQIADGFEAATARYYEPLVRRLALIVGDADEARDLAQATYLRAFEAWHGFDGSDARAWLYTIGLRLASNERARRRRWWRRDRSFHDGTWAIATDPDLWQALDRLDRPVRTALVLGVLDGYTQAEIAGLLGVPLHCSGILSLSPAEAHERILGAGYRVAYRRIAPSLVRDFDPTVSPDGSSSQRGPTTTATCGSSSTTVRTPSTHCRGAPRATERAVPRGRARDIGDCHYPPSTASIPLAT